MGERDGDEAMTSRVDHHVIYIEANAARVYKR
jgi:hypothetical protein